MMAILNRVMGVPHLVRRKTVRCQIAKMSTANVVTVAPMASSVTAAAVHVSQMHRQSVRSMRPVNASTIVPMDNNAMQIVADA